MSFFCFLIFFIPYSTFDWYSYVVWAGQIRSIGFANIYHYHYVNYMPLNMYAINAWQAVCAWLQRDLTANVHFIKLYPMVFDTVTVMLLYRFARKYQASLLTVALLFLPNIAFQFNSFIWGQFDGVYTFFVLLSAHFVLKKQPIWAFVAFVLALNSKIQAIIFWPALISFVWLYIYHGQLSEGWKFLKTVLVSTMLGIGLQILLFAPFTGTSELGIIRLVLERSVSLSKWVTYNADNFWALLGVPSMVAVDTHAWVFGVSYRIWGYGLFTLVTAVAFLPVASYIMVAAFPRLSRKWKLPTRTLHSLPEAVIVQLFALILYIQGLSFFFFLTQMHERYSHPTIVFAGLFAILSRQKIIFFVTCLAYFINLERVQKIWGATIDFNQISWISQFSGLLYLIGLLLAIKYLYNLFLTHSSQKSSR